MALVRGVLRHILGGVCGTEGVHATGPGDQEGAGLDSFWVMDHFFQIRTVGASEEPSSKAGQPWPSRQRRRPHPRILIGGGGEKKTLRLVARYADACNLFDSPELPHKLEVLLEHCEREGRDEAEIEKTALCALSADATVGQAVDAVGRLAGMGIEHVIFSRPTAHQPGAVTMLADVVAQVPR